MSPNVPALSAAPLHVVLGAGQVGTLVAQALVADGARVRMVRRSAAPAPVDGVELVAADLRDPDQAAAALAGAAVAYHCINPLYTEWETVLPAQTRGILAGLRAGATRAQTRLVVLDNLYVHADTTRMNEDSPVAPRARKGELRAEAMQTWLDAHRRGEVAVAIGRAADFFGPGAERAYLGDPFFRRLFAGKAVQALGDPDQPHTYAYTPDVAAALIALGHHDDAFGRVWMLPAQPALSTRALMQRLADATHRELRIQRVPQWLLRTIGLVSGEMREVAEMTYQWQQPYVVDDARIRGLGVVSTPIDTAVTATAAWAIAHYGAAIRGTSGAKAGSGAAARKRPPSPAVPHA